MMKTFIIIILIITKFSIFVHINHFLEWKKYENVMRTLLLQCVTWNVLWIFIKHTLVEERWKKRTASFMVTNYPYIFLSRTNVWVRQHKIPDVLPNRVKRSLFIMCFVFSKHYNLILWSTLEPATILFKFYKKY